ncbi:PC-esterase domain-containing protein 1A-like isoform X2 [Girardinichthys multiradiatus]|uniref:PC-esterase domain-containing protein 1A-like isoform X2 n=1 Tax=Girardinichthys multiradiatus TaxID=208333 RepID=UPI001FAC8415|nr:PC-esterase domain-containing protein 1A-like isoform X2 [Girardinichthys multiradiatus]
MKESVSHRQARLLLHNKFVVVLGDSIQRSVYKDLVVLLQKDKYLSLRQLRSKGEMSFELDCLVEGGCLNQMNNGTEYREVRQFQSDHHLVRFYFVTRVFSTYMQSIIKDFRQGLKPDVVIVNSCVWDISRYNPKWTDDYKENLKLFFDELKMVLPQETLVIWNLTMPLGERIKGGFLVPEIEHKAPQLRYDVIEANFCGWTLASCCEMDVLDLHFQFRFSLQHRTKDGVHWNAIAHRRITALLLRHIAQAWGVRLTADEVPDQKSFYDCSQKPAAANVNSYSEEFATDSLPRDYLSFEENPEPLPYCREDAENFRPAVKPPWPRPRRKHRSKRKQPRYGFDYMPPHYLEPYEDQDHHQFVMRNRHGRPHYAPYSHHRPVHRPFHGYHY